MFDQHVMTVKLSHHRREQRRPNNDCIYYRCVDGRRTTVWSMFPWTTEGRNGTIGRTTGAPADDDDDVKLATVASVISD